VLDGEAIGVPASSMPAYTPANTTRTARRIDFVTYDLRTKRERAELHTSRRRARPRSHDSSCFLVDASPLTHPEAPDSVRYADRLSSRVSHAAAAAAAAPRDDAPVALALDDVPLGDADDERGNLSGPESAVRRAARNPGRGASRLLQCARRQSCRRRRGSPRRRGWP
jgi:hypothetical protein